jgi:hypothetical protein
MMKPFVLMCALAASVPLSATENDTLAKASPHQSVRQAIHADFKYLPKPAVDVPRVQIWSTGTKQAAPSAPSLVLDPNVVTMAPFEVTEPDNLKDLPKILRKQQADAKTAATMKKLGIGVHTLSLRGVTPYVVTVLYIPIEIGFGWNW